MYFASENWAGAHPAISAALAQAADRFTPSYGAGNGHQQLNETIGAIFETDVEVFSVATGTAANSLALASVSRPGGVTYCHKEAHILIDECNAPLFFTGGGKLHGLTGAEAKFSAQKLKDAIAFVDDGGLNAGQPVAASITQATEFGTLYATSEIAGISHICHERGIPLHMDGSRFANALAATNVTPADLTWRAGLDMLSLGGTKNGCWCVELLVFFNRELARDMHHHRKRGGHLLSKSSLVTAQLGAYFEDDLWLDMARHANNQAQKLAHIFEQHPEARLAWPVQVNEVFVICTDDLVAQLNAKGLKFSVWQLPVDCPDLLGAGEKLIRLVACYATTDEHLEQAADALN